MRHPCVFEEKKPGIITASLMREGTEVSGLSIWRLPMRVGAAEVLMGGIGGVRTDANHRHKGYASVVMADAVAWMRENGYDVSVLFGIPDFYHQWGYITTMSRPRIVLTTRVAETCPATCRPAKFRGAELADAMALHNAENASRTGSVIRRAPEWIPWRKGVRWGVKPTVFRYAVSGKLSAVAAFDLDREEVACVDLSAREPAMYAGIVRHAAELALERRVEKITFHAPPDGAFAAFCREQGGCEILEGTPRHAGGMARVINQPQCLAKAAPELTRRLRASRFAAWTGGIDLVTNLGATRLMVTRGRVKTAERSGKAALTLRLPQERLTQLLFGFHSVDFLLAHRFARITPGGRDLAAALFPTSAPYMAQPDMF